MEIYYIIFGLVIILGLIDIYKPIEGEKRPKIFWFIVTLIVLFKGLRWDTGTDFPQYYACFNNVTWSNFYHFERYGVGSDYMEPGYTLLNVLVKTLFDDYTVFLVITNALIMYVYGKTILTYVPQYKFACLALILIATTLFPVRQTLAVSAFVFSIRYVLKRDFKKYLLCVLVAFSFHRSAIFLAFLYPIIVSKFNLKRNIAIYVLIIIFGRYMYTVFDFLKNSELNVIMGGIMNQYDATNENVIEQEISDNNSYLTYISSIVQISFYYFGFSKLKALGEKNIDFDFYNIMLNIYYLNLIFWAISFIPGFGSMNRIPAYFEFGYAFSILIAMLYFKKIKYAYISVLLFLATFTIKYRALKLADAENDLGVNIFVPYKSFIERDEPMRSGIWVY